MTSTGDDPGADVAAVVRERRPRHRSLLAAAGTCLVSLAVAGAGSIQLADPIEPSPRMAVADNHSRYPQGNIDIADKPADQISLSRTIEIDPTTGGVTVPSSKERLRILSDPGSLDIPEAALRAYREAAATLARTDQSCNIDWALLAGIGRVESDHGRYGGATVGADGKTSPHILGLPLDGSPGVAAIADSDGGALDNDTTWDRAVGPMQFIPGTWSMVGSDGDGDGESDPHDLDDAALAAGVYLCAGDRDVSTKAGAESAVFSYNHSDEYVAMVLAIAEAYRNGEIHLPSAGGNGSAPTLDEAPGSGANGEGTGNGSGNGNGNGTGKRGKTGDTQPAASPPSSGGNTSPTPPTSPAPSSPGSPSDDSTDKPSPEPTKPKPTPTDRETTKPKTPPPFIPSDGTLTNCGDSGTWCIDGEPHDFGSAEYVETMQAGDYNGDGTAERILDELEGLAGEHVGVMVKNDKTDTVVYDLQGARYRDRASGELVGTPAKDEESPPPPPEDEEPPPPPEDEEPQTRFSGTLSEVSDSGAIFTNEDQSRSWSLAFTGTETASQNYDGDKNDAGEDHVETLTEELEGLVETGELVSLEIENGDGSPTTVTVINKFDSTADGIEATEGG